MNRVRIVVASIAIMLITSCSPLLIKIASYDMDDMYAPHDLAEIEAKKASQMTLAQRQREQNMASWSTILGIPQQTNTTSVANPAAELKSQSEIYNTPYGERLLALDADSYQLPSSYYMYNEVLEELANYDPTQYSATFDASGNIVITPIYTRAIYNSWDVRPYYRAPWRYGYNPHWNRHYYQYGYYSSWYYDSYYYYGSLYWGYNPYYVHHYYRPPINRPNRPSNKPYSSNYQRVIVKQATNSSGVKATSVGSRQSNGSNVGSQSTTTYNRGASSTNTNTSTRSSGSSTTNSTTNSTTTNSSSGSANSIGR